MEGDKSHCTSKIIPGYFNPLPPHGGRLTSKTLDQLSSPFQSTPSAWRETAVERIYHNVNSFQSTPSAWRETLVLGLIQDVCSISIHSLRMEGDWTRLLSPIRQIYFNPLPPHGGRLCKRLHCNPPNTFQSTPSAWRETPPWLCRACILCHFNPLPPHGGRHPIYAGKIEWNTFQSTPSAWRETERNGCATIPLNHFNPLPPHGGRRLVLLTTSQHRPKFQSTPSAWRETLRPDTNIQFPLFQSTPSAWRETGGQTKTVRREGISIHSLRMEGDVERNGCATIPLNHFNPLPPHGGRLPVAVCVHNHRTQFQSTPSAWRETYGTVTGYSETIFQSTPSAWRETTPQM